MTKTLGSVLAITITPHKKEALKSCQSVEAVAGHGLKGDRYFDIQKEGKNNQLTMIGSEQVKALEKDGIKIEATDTRRNLVTEGVDVNSLLHKRFRIGKALVYAHELCHPCANLQNLLEQPLLKPMHDKGGLRLEILESGVIEVGDSIELVE